MTGDYFLCKKNVVALLFNQTSVYQILRFYFKILESKTFLL